MHVTNRILGHRLIGGPRHGAETLEFIRVVRSCGGDPGILEPIEHHTCFSMWRQSTEGIDVAPADETKVRGVVAATALGELEAHTHCGKCAKMRQTKGA